MGICAEKPWQLLTFNGFSLQIEYALPKHENFEKSSLRREITAKMAQ